MMIQMMIMIIVAMMAYIAEADPDHSISLCVLFLLNILSNVILKSQFHVSQLHLNFVEGDSDQSGRNGGDGKSLSGCYYSHQKTSSQVMMTLVLMLILML